MIEVMAEPILPELVTGSLITINSGSVVTHTAIVRPSSAGERAVSIEYQIDKAAAEAEMKQIAGQIRAEWGIEDIALCRRGGQVSAGDVILVAAVAAPHRKDAFQACAAAVEGLRAMTSVRKREKLEKK